jgi:signal transduction histidine kinase
MGGEQVRALAEEQAALRRVATLVARGVPPEELFAAVTDEVIRLLPVDFALMGRYESDGTLITVAAAGSAVARSPIGARWVREGKNLVTIVFDTGRPARIDSYADSSGPVGDAAKESGIRSSVGTPVIVESRLWGLIVAGSLVEHPLPANTEERLADFTQLLATAIANSQSRASLARLVDEQAALRRVATLVARGVPAETIFAAVAEEVGRLLATSLSGMARYENDDTLTVVATWAAEDEYGGEHPMVPGPWPLEGGDLASTIWRTGRPVRIDDYQGVHGPIAAFVREELGVRCSVGSPIVVEDRVWGALFVHSKQTDQPLLADTESRLSGFTELVATAVANAGSHAELIASRARIVAAADETRRRIERDLHDSTQQRLVLFGLELRAAQATVPQRLGELQDALSRVVEELARVLDELREIAHGIHPAILSEGGLEPALRALRRHSAVPVELDLHAEGRLPEPVEVATYYVVSEGLTNAAKHAHASVVNVELDTHGAILRLAIRDDGVGGAEPGEGTGLLGLSDRIEALGGTLQVISPAGKGTTLLIEVPLEDR